MPVLNDGTVVHASRPEGRVLHVVAPPRLPRGVAVVRGGRGPQGIPGAPGSGFVHEQVAPSASWNIAHPLMRLPNVAIYIAGEQVEADVTSDDTATNVAFPYPVSGYAVLV